MDINTPKSLPSHFRSSPPHTSDSTTNSTPSLKSVDISSDEAINPIHIAPALGELNSAPSFRRARELYKYFHPLTFSSKTPQNDTFDALLSSQAQLVAGRLGGKCLINLLDSLRQYVVAEAVGSPSRTPERPSARVSELEAVNWVDCKGTGPLNESVCQYTVNTAFDPASDRPPFFEVEDLASDPRFASIPLVTGQPYLRYYGGIPLYTQSGIAIGALVIIDNKPRRLMQLDEQKYLHNAAQNVMRLLELHHQSTEHARSRRLNESLNNFVSSGQASKAMAHHSNVPPRKGSQSISGCTFREYDPTKGPKTSTDPFQRAVKLLTNAFSDGPCKCVILDSTSVTAPSGQQISSTFQSGGYAPVLAYSEQADPLFNFAVPSRKCSTQGPNQAPIRLLATRLSAIIESYPAGIHCLFDPSGNLYFEEPASPGADDTLLSDSDAQTIYQCFPDATSVYIRPIWNARTHRHVAVFTVTTSEYRLLSLDNDLPFLNAFCNCLSVELAQLSTAAADKEKTDFIGTISHELRSPLHGILASCELLQTGGLSEEQKQTLEMVDSCGRTLLDTINMVLDWSKVNTFEQSLEAPASGPALADGKGRRASIAQAQRLPNLYGHVDLAAVVEEVVEGAVLAQTYQNVQAIDFADLSSQARGRDSQRGFVKKPNNQPGSLSSFHKLPVEVALQVSKAPASWTYYTQPGAFRRVVMSLVGNALKFTSKGSVSVFLRICPDQDVAGDGLLDSIELVVEDTGIGMALDYVQNRLYQAFTQENPIAAGTGLGLSLTKSILDMLSGTIHVESKQSEGTRVVVNIPMQQSRKVEHQTAGARRKSEAGTEETPSTAGSTSTYVDLATRFQDLGVEERIACFHPEVASLSSKPRLTQQALDLYLSEWFNLPIRTWSPAEQGRSLVIVDDTDVDALIGTLKSNDIHIRPTLVVLSSDHARISKTMAAAGLSGHYELITKPFGPYRAGKALLSAVAHLESSDTHRTPTNAPPQEPQFHESSPKTAFVSSMTASLETSLHLDVCGNEASANARMALNSPQSTPSTALTQPNLEPGEFPFPRNSNYSPQSGPTESRTSSLATTPFSTEQTSAPAAETTHRSIEPPTLRPEISHSQTERPATTNVDRPTRILLVDDNAINLRLITTYMKKLHYTHLDTASDGSIARDLFRTAIESSEPHDVVWMDLSMPIMDGFEATKAIRDLELEHAQGLSPIQKPSPAMIIALTGLASEKDQARAFEAGVDLYVTKPASFKEVGRMMKSWEKNGGVRASDALPHGPVTGATAASPEEMQKST